MGDIWAKVSLVKSTDNIFQLQRNARRNDMGAMASDAVLKERLSRLPIRCAMPKKKQRELRLLPPVK